MHIFVALRRLSVLPKLRFAAAALFLVAFLVIPYTRKQALAIVPLNQKPR